MVALYFRGEEADSYPHAIYGPAQVMARGASGGVKVLFWDGAQHVLPRQDCFAVNPNGYKLCLAALVTK